MSARDPRHAAIRVWTARNEVFGCGDPGLAATLARAVIQGIDSVKAAADYLGHALSSDDRRRHLTACRQLEYLCLGDATMAEIDEAVYSLP